MRRNFVKKFILGCIFPSSLVLVSLSTFAQTPVEPSGLINTALELPKPLVNSDFPVANHDEVHLGQLLFYDPILSGNRNISCATCHHPDFATGDGLSLGIGEGGIGLGPKRHEDPDNLPEQRIARNAPPLFNVGAQQITAFFHDGRIEKDESQPNGFRTPLFTEMVTGFDNLLSAQTMFPVLSPDEMAGHYQENSISKLVRQGRLTGKDGAWAEISKRVSNISEYQTLFEVAYPDIASGRALAFTDISNAIAAFVAFEWRADNSPFDEFLRGKGQLSDEASRGMELFFDKAKCVDCHSGQLLSDQSYHAMGFPQFGPGKVERFEDNQRDEGRFRVTGQPRDLYAFRTPPLRNVMQTGPWGHDGAYTDMVAFLTGHLTPSRAIGIYQRSSFLPEMVNIKPDWTVMDDLIQSNAIVQAADRREVQLSNSEIADLVAFLKALDDPISLKGRLGIPDHVPSGLEIDR